MNRTKHIIRSQYTVAFISCFALLLSSVFPLIIQFKTHDFNGSLFYQTTYDEIYYASLIQKKTEGFGTPFLWEHRLEEYPKLTTGWNMHPVTLKPLKIIVKLGIPLNILFISLHIILPMLLLWALFFLFRLYFDKRNAWIAGITVLASANILTANSITTFIIQKFIPTIDLSFFNIAQLSFLPFFRTPFPGFAYVLFIGILLIIISAFRQKRIWILLLTIPLLAGLRYSYVSLFNASFVFMHMYGLIYLIDGTLSKSLTIKERVQCSLILIGTLIFSISILRSIFTYFDLPYVNSRNLYITVSQIIGTLVLLGSFIYHKQKKSLIKFLRSNIEIITLIITPFILLNTQVITGKSWQVYNYEIYISWLMISIGIVLLFRKYITKKSNVFLVVAVLILILEGEWNGLSWQKNVSELSYLKKPLEQLTTDESKVILSSGNSDGETLSQFKGIFPYNTSVAFFDIPTEKITRELQDRTANTICAISSGKISYTEIARQTPILHIFLGLDEAYPYINNHKVTNRSQIIEDLGNKFEQTCLNFKRNDIRYRIDYILLRSNETVHPSLREHTRIKMKLPTPIDTYTLYEVFSNK